MKTGHIIVLLLQSGGKCFIQWHRKWRKTEWPKTVEAINYIYNYLRIHSIPNKWDPRHRAIGKIWNPWPWTYFIRGIRHPISGQYRTWYLRTENQGLENVMKTQDSRLRELLVSGTRVQTPLSEIKRWTHKKQF